jgi:hypothetical protein
VPALFTEAALDVEAAPAELTIIPAEMPDSSIHEMRNLFAIERFEGICSLSTISQCG